MTARVWTLAATLAALSYLATGWTFVASGEVAVVRRLGRVLPQSWGPGPHLGWPLGFDDVTRVRLEEVRRLDVGLAGIPGAGDAPGAGEFLTGDLNLVRARAAVQYRVSDPVAFAFRADGIEPILGRLAEASLTRALARQGIEATLRDGKAAAARDAADDLARSARGYGLGVAVLGVSLTDARPPAEVAPDFAAAQSARSDHDRRLNEAATYVATSATHAKAESSARLEAARARADRILALTRARASRFLALLAEADDPRTRARTARRLYLDAVRELLTRVGRKIVLTPDEPLDLSLFGPRPTSLGRAPDRPE